MAPDDHRRPRCVPAPTRHHSQLIGNLHLRIARAEARSQAATPPRAAAARAAGWLQLVVGRTQARQHADDARRSARGACSRSRWRSSSATTSSTRPAACASLRRGQHRRLVGIGDARLDQRRLGTAQAAALQQTHFGAQRMGHVARSRGSAGSASASWRGGFGATEITDHQVHAASTPAGAPHRRGEQLARECLLAVRAIATSCKPAHGRRAPAASSASLRPRFVWSARPPVARDLRRGSARRRCAPRRHAARAAAAPACTHAVADHVVSEACSSDPRPAPARSFGHRPRRQSEHRRHALSCRARGRSPPAAPSTRRVSVIQRAEPAAHGSATRGSIANSGVVGADRASRSLRPAVRMGMQAAAFEARCAQCLQRGERGCRRSGQPQPVAELRRAPDRSESATDRPGRSPTALHSAAPSAPPVAARAASSVS